MVSTNVFLSMVYFFVVFDKSLQNDDGVLQEIGQNSPCTPSERQKTAFHECSQAIMGAVDLNIEDMRKPENIRRVGPCMWSKLGIFGGDGIDMTAFKLMINEMPASDEIKERLISSAENCRKQVDLIKRLKCVGEESKKICQVAK